MIFKPKQKLYTIFFTEENVHYQFCKLVEHLAENSPPAEKEKQTRPD